ncbi:MAG TPA: pyridoxamine 5'-phosphate oxidase family protein [Myxococcota bacterium]|nr:pyridoxamine 5'-phosphate oxidase family protein [Myxococcota bacterium]
MTWDEFARADPALAELGFERIDSSGLVMLATLRKNGFPRISPIEALFFEGALHLGMMWRSPKALDLLRDPRCTVHTLVSKKDGTEGDFKLYGRALALCDLDARRRYCDALSAKIGWKPEEPEFHVFALDIEAAGFAQTRAGKHIRKSWRANDSR